MKENLVDAGLLEIHRFLPPALLEDFDLEEMDMETFLGYLAQARYIRELEINVITSGIARAFPKE